MPQQSFTFVQQLCGLKYLNLCFPRNSVDSATSSGFYRLLLRKGHKDTIMDLYWGEGANNVRETCRLNVPPREDLEPMCRECVNLRQLAIPMPILRIDNALSGQWGEFGVYVVSLRPARFDQCCLCTDRIQDLLASLPKLKTLRILTWPIIHDEEYVAFSMSRANRVAKKRIYLRYLDIIATSIVKQFRLVRTRLQRKNSEIEYQSLSVLIFGSAEQRDMITRTDDLQDYWSFGPISYKVKRKETEFGVVTKANRIDSQHMEYEEPIAYVVDEDTDQGLSLEAYSWGS